MKLAYYQSLLIDVAIEVGLIEKRPTVGMNPLARPAVDFRKKTDCSKTDETKIEYINIFRRMCCRYGVHRFGKILLMRSDKLSKRSVSVFRSSIFFVAAELIRLEIDTPIMREQLAHVKKIVLGNCKKKGSSGASLRKKYVTDDELTRLISWLVSNCNKKNYHTAALLFRATILCGLRPAEWRTVRYCVETNALVIQNAKSTNGRANGNYRVLLLSGLHETDRGVILEAIEAKNNYLADREWKTLHQEVGLTLAAANKALWPRRKEKICWYSARHQFCANTKLWVRQSENPDPRIVAAAMGHRVVETSNRNYARIQRGRAGKRLPDGHTESCVQPAVQNIELVDSPRNQSIGVAASKVPSFSNV